VPTAGLAQVLTKRPGVPVGAPVVGAQPAGNPLKVSVPTLTLPAAEVTVAVNVTVVPKVEAGEETVTATDVLAGFTVWLMVAEGGLLAKLPAPV
jgi:hypothetical protein